jgi:HD-GYP domain-containing protein (c-di-GMP phosphodiesterase class II)
MTTDRPYRPALPPSAAFETLLENAGAQFDPAIVDAFVRCWERGDIQGLMSGRAASGRGEGDPA